MIDPEIKIKELFKLYKDDELTKEDKEEIAKLIKDYKQLKGWNALKVYNDD